MPDAPFDTALPSPLAAIGGLRAKGEQSVVRDASSSAVQRRMAPPGALEDALWEVLGSARAPLLMVLTGSSGCGKSVVINNMLERELETGADRIRNYVADATHSDAPGQEQVERLARFFSEFADGSEPPPGPCRIIAMNTGMALRFFYELSKMDSPPPLSGIESLLRRRMGVPGATERVAGWLEEAVLVVNLDHRTTAGSDGDVLDELLGRLNPAREDGVLEGVPRCTTCTVRDWCWPMANLAAISSPDGRRALGDAVRDVALSRGRQVPPRALWDLAANLAFSGLDADGDDPCMEIARVAEIGDHEPLLEGLACSAAMQNANQDSLVGEVAIRDPGYQASASAHEILSEAGLDPEQDGQNLETWLGGGEVHPALQRASAFLRAGNRPLSAVVTGRLLARAAWLGGRLTARSELPEIFREALSEQLRNESGRAVERALAAIEEGLVGMFGFRTASERYYPTASTVPSARADLLVEIKLIDDGVLLPAEDPIVASNSDGARLVGYRPLALFVTAADRSIAVDFPLWQLLERASNGSPTSAADLERFVSLRQAIRAVGAEAGGDERKPLLIRELAAGGRRFPVNSRGATGSLRISEVVQL